MHFATTAIAVDCRQIEEPSMGRDFFDPELKGEIYMSNLLGVISP